MDMENVMSSNKPVKEFRLGRILGLIWLNEDDSGNGWHNVSISRLYKDGNEWKKSTSFGRDDLPLVAKVADLCHTWIYQASQDQTEGQGKTSSNKQAVNA